MCGPRRGGGGGGTGGSGPPLENHNAIEFLGKTGPNPLENHKATKPVFNVGPSSARHLNGISLVGRRCPPFSGSWILSPLINKKTHPKNVRVGPL